jgi:hypothetical protein
LKRLVDRKVALAFAEHPDFIFMHNRSRGAVDPCRYLAKKISRRPGTQSARSFDPAEQSVTALSMKWAEAGAAFAPRAICWELST